MEIGYITQPDIQFGTIGNYTITLNVTDEDNMYDSISKKITVKNNSPPNILNVYPLNNSNNHTRPISEFNITISDRYIDHLSIILNWINHTDKKASWKPLYSFYDIYNGSYTFNPPTSTSWIWGILTEPRSVE